MKSLTRSGFSIIRKVKRSSWKSLSARDDEIRLAAVLGALEIAPPHHPIATQIYLSYLGDARELILMRVIDGLSFLEVTEAHDRVLAHLAHPSQYVVSAVHRYLRRLFPEEAKPILYVALRDERYIVRETEVDELDELSDAEAAPLIRPLLDDPQPRVPGGQDLLYQSGVYGRVGRGSIAVPLQCGSHESQP